MNYEKAKLQAQANAAWFGVDYYVAGTTMGIEVTRDKPTDETRIFFVAHPSINLADCLKSLYK